MMRGVGEGERWGVPRGMGHAGSMMLHCCMAWRTPCRSQARSSDNRMPPMCSKHSCAAASTSTLFREHLSDACPQVQVAALSVHDRFV